MSSSSEGRCPDCGSPILDEPWAPRLCVACLAALAGDVGYGESDPGSGEERTPRGATLPRPSRFGPYQVLGLLGAGGMGEVYRARDTRLRREVALKVLPAAFASDPARLARFEREARVLASLSHPGIASIHGLEESEGETALVLELVEGTTLSRRIAKGALSVSESLEIAGQIASALEAAHEQGIVHRDLKPGNVMVRSDGVVKVLDFGLAKALVDEASGDRDAPTFPPTRSAPAMTSSGVILGTSSYMSPEQARGQAVDKRTDLWALGCVLYEMLVGEAAFGGETVTDVLAAVVGSQPDWSRLPAETPASVRTLLRRCLEKDRRQRLDSAAAVRLELRDASLVSGVALASTSAAAAAVPRSRSRQWLPAAVLAGVAGIALGGLAVWTLRPRAAPAGEVSRVLVRVTPADRLAFPLPGEPSWTAFALSPDGRTLVFVGKREEGPSQLYLREMVRLEAVPIVGTENGHNPFFSPDGEWVGFWSNGPPSESLKKVPIDGGTPVTVCEQLPTPVMLGASWGSDGRIVFASARSLWSVPASGGAPQELSAVGADYSHRLPHVLPGAEAVLFTRQRSAFRWHDAEIVVRSLRTGEEKTLVHGGSDARYSPTGHLVYARLGKLLAASFDLSRLEVTGPPSTVVEGVAHAVNGFNLRVDTGAAQFAISDSGDLVYVPGGILRQIESSFVWVDRSGKVEALPLPPAARGFPRLSPDGRFLSFATMGLDRNTWIYDLARGTTSRLTNVGQNVAGTWTPDGLRLALSSTERGPGNLFWMLADGSGPAERLAASDRTQHPSSWSPDAKSLAFVENYREIKIWTRGEGGPTVQTFVPEPSNSPVFSPDGRWLAYSSAETGSWEVYVRPYPGPGGRHTVSTNGGYAPMWSRDGRELYYVVDFPDGETIAMMAVRVAMEDELVVERPRALFEGLYATALPLRSYDLAADGRFLMMKVESLPPEPRITEMVLVQNWSDELRRSAPVR